MISAGTKGQHIRPLRSLLHLGPNVITDRTFITLGFKMLLRMGLLLRLGPNVITDGTFITLGSSYYTCAFSIFLFKLLKLSATGRSSCWFSF